MVWQISDPYISIYVDPLLFPSGSICSFANISWLFFRFLFDLCCRQLDSSVSGSDVLAISLFILIWDIVFHPVSQSNGKPFSFQTRSKSWKARSSHRGSLGSEGHSLPLAEPSDRTEQDRTVRNVETTNSTVLYSRLNVKTRIQCARATLPLCRIVKLQEVCWVTVCSCVSAAEEKPEFKTFTMVVTKYLHLWGCSYVWTCLHSWGFAY